MKYIRMKLNKNKGFTLVELIIVLVILAILAALLIPSLTGYVDNANQKKILARARQYQNAAQSVYNDAYANNFMFSSISYPSVGTESGVAIDIKSDKEKKSAHYENMFKNLAEIEKGDFCYFGFNNGKITNASVTVDKYTAIYDGKKWKIKE